MMRRNQEYEDALKIGAITSLTGQAIFINVESGDREQFTLLGRDPVDDSATIATRRVVDSETRSVTLEHGRIIGNIVECSKFIWEKRVIEVEGALAVTAIGVAIKTLHKRSKKQ
jgi:hypothetical protein